MNYHVKTSIMSENEASPSAFMNYLEGEMNIYKPSKWYHPHGSFFEKASVNNLYFLCELTAVQECLKKPIIFTREGGLLSW